MSGFVKLHCSMLRSTTWKSRPERDLFITALLMAVPRELKEPTPQLYVDKLEETGWVIPPGWYGFCDTSGDGIIDEAKVDPELGYQGLHRLGEPELKSRSQDYDGRRLVRIDGGYIVLNYKKYRDKDNTTAQRSARYRQNKSRRDVTHDTPAHGVTDRSVTQAEAEAEAERDLAKAENSKTKDLTGSAQVEPLPAAPRELPRHVANFERSIRAPRESDGRARALFEAYREESGKTGADYDHKARELFERLVDESVQVEDVRLVVRGAKLDDWATGTAMLSAPALLGSSAQRQRFSAMARDPPRPRGLKAPKQPDGGEFTKAFMAAGKEKSA